MRSGDSTVGGTVGRLQQFTALPTVRDDEGVPMNGQQMTGAQALVESLKHAGAEVVFGLPGGAILLPTIR